MREVLHVVGADTTIHSPVRYTELFGKQYAWMADKSGRLSLHRMFVREEPDERPDLVTDLTRPAPSQEGGGAEGPADPGLVRDGTPRWGSVPAAVLSGIDTDRDDV